jgi:7-cyano-7-deazaguanine synthase in queuosine biosynthesis
MTVYTELPTHIADVLYTMDDSDDFWAELSSGESESYWILEQHRVPENPAAEDISAHMEEVSGSFKIVVPISGGLDSSTLALMAIESGHPCLFFYVNGGQEYAKLELAAARAIVAPHKVTELYCPFGERRYKHIIPGRNAEIVWKIAETMARARRQWGQVWFGNLQGESPIVGGDKSARFFATMQGVLHGSGIDLHLLSPLIGLDKPDLIRWWHDHGYASRLRETKSCFSPSDRRCGECQSCFRTFVALVGSGMYDLRGSYLLGVLGEWFLGGWDFRQHIAKYEGLMTSPVNPYNDRRTRDTLRAIALLRRGNLEASK